MRRPNHASRFEGIAKTKLQASRASDTETLQSQATKAGKKRLSLSRLEILHGRLARRCKCCSRAGRLQSSFRSAMRVLAALISAGYFGSTDWGICGRSAEYKAQSEHARTASSLFCASHHFNRRHQRRGANSRRPAPSTFNPSLEDCPGALNSRLP